MAAVTVGGAGSLLSAGSAKAANGGTICNFNGGAGPTSTVCANNQTYTLDDKDLTLLQIPTLGLGYLDFLSNQFPPLGPENDTWNVKTNFAPPYGPSATPGEFIYRIKIDQVKEPFAYFKKVSLDSQHNGDNPRVDKYVYETLLDLQNGTNLIAQLTSLDGSASEFDFQFNRYKDLFVKDVYAPGLNGDLSTLNNSYTQGDSSIPTVPGPLPLLGAGMALGFSRKLRSRIKGSVKA